ncbi:MAG: SCO family protein [Verrucomicrobia bacterium]|nr:SCO family protein [Verrucomicrobiota bacterium]
MTAPVPERPGPRPANKKLTVVVWTLLVAGLALVIVVGMREIWISAERKNFRHLPSLAQVPDFRFVERDGQSRTLRDLEGKVWVANFFFSTCPGPCPALTSQVGEISRAVARAKGEVKVVSISVDPETDTPEKLRVYADKYGAGANWWFLTGSLEDTFRLARDGFKLALEANPPAGASRDGKMLHSTKIALVDGQGRIRGYYSGTDADLLARILPDIGDLLEEKKRP